MKAFISGATGVLGRRVVQALVAEGHPVVGLSRSQANTDWLRRHGAEAREGDLFDPEQLAELVSDCDAVLHLATAIPTKARSSAADWAINDRIRREGTQAMVQAALRSRCQLYVQQSITLIYGDRGGAWVDEQTEILPAQVRMLRSAVDMERIVRTAMHQDGLPATILRFGSFYSHDSAQTRMMFDLTRKGRFPIVGNGGAYWNMINVDDAARAVALTITRHPQAVAQTFNICDDEPVPYGELQAFVAEALGAKPPMHLPIPLAKLLIGSDTVDYLRASVRCRNQHIKDHLGWEAAYPSYREGFRAEIEAWARSS